jgi:hypothetical protein
MHAWNACLAKFSTSTRVESWVDLEYSLNPSDFPIHVSGCTRQANDTISQSDDGSMSTKF